MEITRFRNLTPHQVLMRDVDGSEFSPIPAEERWARMTEYTSKGQRVQGVPVQDWWPGDDVDGLPDEEPGTGLSLIATGGFAREDIYIPGSEIRDDSGRIVACLGLRHVVNPRRG